MKLREKNRCKGKCRGEQQDHFDGIILKEVIQTRLAYKVSPIKGWNKISSVYTRIVNAR